jgi:ATP-dependent RNA helicase DeaD
VDAVFNFDIPLDEEYYVHRIGRTGRAGKAGKAFTFVVGREIHRLREIQQYTKVKIKRGVIPSYEDIVGLKKAKFIERIKEAVTEGGLEVFADMIEPLHHAGLRDEEIILGLIKMNMGVQKNQYADAELGGEDREDRPRRDRDKRGFDRDRERSGDRRGGRREDRGGSASGGGSRFFGNRTERAANGRMVRLQVNVGRDHNIRPGDIVGAIAGETGIPGNVIGDIDIYDAYSYVEVPKDDVKKVLRVMDNNSIRGKRVQFEIAK